MKLIPFSINSYTKDRYFIVDDDSYNTVTKHKWRLECKRKYIPYYAVVRNAYSQERKAGSPRKITLARFILGIHLQYAKPKEEIDHINRNTLDNRKQNLRLVSRQVNQRNKGNNTRIGVGLWGATYNRGLKHNKKWQANFHIKGKTYMCGYFDSEEEAHKASVIKFKEITGKDSGY